MPGPRHAPNEDGRFFFRIFRRPSIRQWFGEGNGCLKDPVGLIRMPARQSKKSAQIATHRPVGTEHRIQSGQSTNLVMGIGSQVSDVSMGVLQNERPRAVGNVEPVVFEFAVCEGFPPFAENNIGIGLFDHAIEEFRPVGKP